MTTGVDYGVLYGGTASAADTIASLVADLATGTASGGDKLLALRAAERDPATRIAATAKQPQVRRTLDAFNAAIARAKTPADLLADPNALRVLLTVNGLGGQSAYPALARKALLSDPADPSGLASRLSGTNANWKRAASTYQFATKGLAVLRDPKTLANIASSYAEVSWRESLDKATPGLSNALDFRARAKSATSADAILGDATFRTVVTTALGIPREIAYQPLGTQERAITDHLDVGRLQDPRYVDALTQRYLLNLRDPGTDGSSGLDALAVRGQALVV